MPYIDANIDTNIDTNDEDAIEELGELTDAQKDELRAIAVIGVHLPSYIAGLRASTGYVSTADERGTSVEISVACVVVNNAADFLEGLG